MSITAALIVFAVTWFMVFFMVLPMRFTSQGQTGDVVPGTPKSAPAVHLVGKKAWITTGITVVIWGAVVWFILSGVVSIDDLARISPLGLTTEPAPDYLSPHY